MKKLMLATTLLVAGVSTTEAATIQLLNATTDQGNVTVSPGQSFPLKIVVLADQPFYGMTLYLSAPASVNSLITYSGRTIDAGFPLSDLTTSNAQLLGTTIAAKKDIGATSSNVSNTPAGTYTLGTFDLTTSASTPAGVYSINITPDSLLNDNGAIPNEYPLAAGNFSVTVAVPEPASLGLIGLAGLLLVRRRMA